MKFFSGVHFSSQKKIPGKKSEKRSEKYPISNYINLREEKSDQSLKNHTFPNNLTVITTASCKIHHYSNHYSILTD
ncbi:hypothetical protein M8J77_017535 [Diaphorina citri]|nr:hypothetical protein M8J77_017535 [Diaphorina citri]